MARPSLEKSSYLQTIGNGLHPDINIFWTGNYLAEDFSLDLRFLIATSMTSSVVDRVDKNLIKFTNLIENKTSLLL
jgi:hypothetical protein